MKNNRVLQNPALGEMSLEKPSLWVAAVIFLGFASRLYLFNQNPVINPDGYLYIQQAKALYFGLYDQLLSCYLYFSPYPLAIAAAYPIAGDWVVAAQGVSIFFSTLVLFSLYGLLRCFLPCASAVSTLAVYALLPVHVLVGRDVLRDPMYWFFAVTGLYCFVCYMEKRRPLLLFASSLFFAIGAWARIECSLFILVSAVFIPFTGTRKKWIDLGIFLSPYVVLCLVGVVIWQISGVDLQGSIKVERIFTRPFDFLASYNELRAELKTLYHLDAVTDGSYFFPRVRNLVWLIALGTLVVTIVETLLYVVFIFLVMGMAGCARIVGSDRRWMYLFVLSLLALVLLYTQILYNWSMTSRYLSVFLFPAAVFIGKGMEKGALLLSRRFRVSARIGCALVCLVALAIFIPKNLRATFARDKLIYPAIGRHIAQLEENKRAVSVCGAFKRVRVVNFHANLNYPGAPCFDNDGILSRTDGEGLRFIFSNGFDYFLWDEKGWYGREINMLIEHPKSPFKKIRQWDSERLGKIVLYKVVK